MGQCTNIGYSSVQGIKIGFSSAHCINIGYGSAQCIIVVSRRARQPGRGVKTLMY